jgi:HEAT repeat protein
MPDKLQELLDALLDEHKPIPALDLSQLSDLNSAQSESLFAFWPQAPTSNRQSVLRELGKLAHDHIEFDFECVNRIALGDPDAEVRRQAVANLWECEEPSLASTLIEMVVSDQDPGVRARAAEALGRFVYLGEVDKLEPVLLRRIEDTLLQAAANEETGETSLRALESLGYSSRSEVVGLIEGAYAASDEGLKRASVMAMGRSANEKWVPPHPRRGRQGCGRTRGAQRCLVADRAAG